MSSPSAINTQSLISPISNTAFEKLLKQPTLLIPFLNSILAEKFLITAIEETSKVVSIAPDALETLGTAVSDATSEQHAQASATSKLEYSYDKNADYDESNGLYDTISLQKLTRTPLLKSNCNELTSLTTLTDLRTIAPV
ncbi:hypothetical protein KEM48_001042 [Puccinia striiformis f. sp. tritici PST-130]|nr:hypothetical protein KEM48_001042 [Puccinia striiformis f. sp. tritici PST-130]